MVEDEEADFRRCFEQNFAAVHRYVSARSGDAADAGDIVAEVFSVAWRRREVRPSGESERFWLLGVARRVLADHRRAATRRDRLLKRLTLQRTPAASGEDGAVDERVAERLEVAMSRLGERDREVLRLLAWDDVPRPEAASLLGCSVNALNIRVHRALRRLERELGSTTIREGHAGTPADLPDRRGSGPWTSTS